jgi:cation transport protein ChaC
VDSAAAWCSASPQPRPSPSCTDFSAGSSSSSRPGTPPRWVSALTDAGPLAALTFAVDRASPFYSGRLPPDAVAEVLATAAGHWGSGAEYLYNTVSHLEALGIRDRNLWHLQALVAQRLAAG